MCCSLYSVYFDGFIPGSLFHYSLAPHSARQSDVTDARVRSPVKPGRERERERATVVRVQQEAATDICTRGLFILMRDNLFSSQPGRSLTSVCSVLNVSCVISFLLYCSPKLPTLSKILDCHFSDSRMFFLICRLDSSFTVLCFDVLSNFACLFSFFGSLNT